MYVKIHLWCLYTFTMFTVPERSMSVADLSQPDWGTWLSKADLTHDREVVGLFSTRLHESF